MPREAPVDESDAGGEGKGHDRGDLWYDMVREIKRQRVRQEVQMPVYVAMLRGVNVGGNPLKMDWLRGACEDIGLQDVRTYVQSGNIVFSSRASAAKLGANAQGDDRCANAVAGARW